MNACSGTKDNAWFCHCSLCNSIASSVVEYKSQFGIHEKHENHENHEKKSRGGCVSISQGASLAGWVDRNASRRSDVAYVAQSLRRLRFPGTSVAIPPETVYRHDVAMLHVKKRLDSESQVTRIAPSWPSKNNILKIRCSLARRTSLR